jgi:hypothetical protein
MDAELQAQIQAINRQRKDIELAQRFLKRCHGCQLQPIRQVCDACDVSSGREGIEILKVIWDEPSRS